MGGRPAKAIDAADGARTKEEIEARRAAENKLKGDGRVTCPKYLTRTQRKIFTAIKKLLTEAGIIGSIDGYVISFCAVSIDRVAEIDAAANENPAKQIDRDTVAARSKYMTDFYRCCNELCLSPQARAKVGVLAASGRKAAADPLKEILAGED